MKEMKFLFLLAFVSVSGLLPAQQSKTSYRFHSTNSLVLVNGSNGVSASLQSVNGFKKGALFAGIGTGIDYYLYRTIPLFVDTRYVFGKKKNKIFTYADGGVNFSWVQTNLFINPAVIRDGNNGNSVYKNGLYSDVGFGYNIGMKKENALVISLGYSYKSLKKTETYQDWRSHELFTSRNTYNLNRIMLKVGWQF